MGTEWEYHGIFLHPVSSNMEGRPLNSVGKMDIEIGKTMERNEMKDLPANRV